MNLQSLHRDAVFIEKPNGSRNGPYKTAVVDGAANIFDATLDVDEGDKLIRPLPNGKEEVYLVTHTAFSQGLRGAIPPHFSLKLQKTTSIQPAMARSTTVHINNSSGVQVGDHNVVNIQNALNELIQRIDVASASPEQKSEAKSLLANFLAHPLVCSVLGAVAGGITGTMSS